MLDVGPYVETTLELGPLTVRPQLRFDATYIEGSRHDAARRRHAPRRRRVAPRGASIRASPLAYRVTPRLTTTASAGLYHQPPDPGDLSAVFGTPSLGLSQATHETFGESLRIAKKLTLEMVAFDK